MKKSLAILLSILMVLFALAACGGSGGGGGGGGGGTTYDYKAALFEADDSGALSALLGMQVPGTAFENSTSGTLTYKILQSPLGPGGSGTADLTVDEFGFANIVEAGDDPAFGSATPDASLFFSVETIKQPSGDDTASLVVGTNRTSGMSTSDVDGVFTCAYMESAVVTNSVSAFPFTMDGNAGTWDGGPAGNGTFTVSSDGSLTFYAGGGSVKGAVRQGGDVFFISVNDMNDFGLVICVDDEELHTVSDLEGHFRIAGMGVMNTGGSPDAFMGEAFFDGAGNGSMAAIANSNGYIDIPERELQGDIAYTVNGGSLKLSGDDRPIIITPNRDFFMIIDDDDSDGSTELIVGARYTPEAEPAESYLAGMGGTDYTDVRSQFLSATTHGGGIAPGDAGLFGIRQLWSSDGSFESMSVPYMVNSVGIMELSADKTVWGFANASTGTYLAAITNQTSDDYVNMLVGQETSSGLSNATAFGLYNCAGFDGISYDFRVLNMDGNGTITNGGDLYRVEPNGLMTLWIEGVLYKGVLRSDNGGLLVMHRSEGGAPGLWVCIEDQNNHSDNGELTDSYIAVQYDITGGGGVTSTISQLDFKGDGNIDSTALYNSTGPIPSPYSNTITNAVTYSANGANIESQGEYAFFTSSLDAFVISFGDGFGKESMVFGIKK